mmetsp:Transcript_53311/g.137851  ORF Transcript_53311/g.137851 Transcript_53311/m.137851 type:complete len:229 (+) Transcript_53311:658-1344(+)
MQWRPELCRGPNGAWHALRGDRGGEAIWGGKGCDSSRNEGHQRPRERRILLVHIRTGLGRVFRREAGRREHEPRRCRQAFQHEDGHRCSCDCRRDRRRRCRQRTERRVYLYAGLRALRLDRRRLGGLRLAGPLQQLGLLRRYVRPRQRHYLGVDRLSTRNACPQWHLHGLPPRVGRRCAAAWRASDMEQWAGQGCSVGLRRTRCARKRVLFGDRCPPVSARRARPGGS